MQINYNELLTKEENERIEREIKMTPEQILNEIEKNLNKDTKKEDK